MLTIQPPSGETFDSREFSVKKLNRTDCMIEAKAKEEALEQRLGKSVSYGYGLYAAYGGTLVGFSVGCDGRAKKDDTWIYVPRITDPDDKKPKRNKGGNF